MIQQRLSLEATRAAGRYSLLLESWKALSHRTLMSSSGLTTASISNASMQAFASAQAFLDHEREHCADVIDEIASEAHTASVQRLRSAAHADLAPAADEHLSAIENYLLSEIVAQAHRDIATLRKTLHQTLLDVSISARSRGVSDRIALVELQIERSVEPKFTFSDRAMRRWDSRRYISTLWRHALLAAYNETVLHTVADHNQSLVDVVSVNGLVETLALHQSPTLRSYGEAREELFHPNSNLFLVPHDVPA